jgi:hypothetical protein
MMLRRGPLSRQEICMPERDFPPTRQQRFSESQGTLAQAVQPWWGFRVGLSIGLIVLVGALMFFWSSWFVI